MSLIVTTTSFHKLGTDTDLSFWYFAASVVQFQSSVLLHY